jgi:hypothetical protein
LIWQCVDDAEFSRAKAALHLASAPTRGLARTKQALSRRSEHAEAQLDLSATSAWTGIQRRLSRGCRRSHAKRPPKFIGS